MKPLLHQQINRRLLLLALAVATLGSLLLASVSGLLVLRVTLNEAQKQVASVERKLSSIATSFLPLYEVQRQLQLAATSERLRSVLLLNDQGQVLAASDSALVGMHVQDLRVGRDSGALPPHWLSCLQQHSSDPCRMGRSSSVFIGPLPWVGGDHLIRFIALPLALEGQQALAEHGWLLIEVDLHLLLLQSLRLVLLVFVCGLVPLFLTASALVLVMRRQLLPELLALAQTDGLSGVFNRRAFLEVATARLEHHRSLQLPVVVALIDIDHFKQINDTYGHAAGDEVIRCMAVFLRASLRRTDLVGRLGGDEFAVLVEAAAEPAFDLMNRLCRKAAQQPWLLADGRQVGLSLSAGIVAMGFSCSSTSQELLALLLEEADAALYEAKRQGRNRVVTQNNPPSASS